MAGLLRSDRSELVGHSGASSVEASEASTKPDSRQLTHHLLEVGPHLSFRLVLLVDHASCHALEPHQTVFAVLNSLAACGERVLRQGLGVLKVLGLRV